MFPVPLGDASALLALYQVIEKHFKDKAAIDQALGGIKSTVHEIFPRDFDFILRLLKESQPIAAELVSKKLDKRDYLVLLFKDAYDEAPGLAWSSYQEHLVEQFVTRVSEILLGYGINEVQSGVDYLDSKAQSRHEEAQETTHQDHLDTQKLIKNMQLNVEQQNRQEAGSSNGLLQLRRFPKQTSTFAGRAKEITGLSEPLYGNMKIIYGLGGVGKTQLAAQYATLHQEDYNVIWRVRSGSSLAITADLEELAVALKLTKEKEEEQTDKKLFDLRNWLSANLSWLLIFDDLQDSAELSKVLPLDSISRGKVLITSRNSIWGNFAELIHLDVWSEEETAQFLTARLQTGKYSDEVELKTLGHLLGNLPLALEQAAAYISSTLSDVQTYSTLFTERRKDLWRDRRHEKHPHDYPFTVATTWMISIEEVQKTSPEALSLLQTCSLFAPDDIPISLLAWGKESLPEPLRTVLDDSLALNSTVAALSEYSLVSWQDDFLSVHQLVQMVVRDNMVEMEPLLEAVLQLQIKSFPFSEHDSSTWEVSRLMVRHMLTSSMLATQANIDKTYVFEAMSQSIRCLRFMSDKDFEATSPTPDQIQTNTVEVLTAFGEALVNREESLEFILATQQQMTDVVKEVFGDKHWRYASSESKLGHIYTEIALYVGEEGAVEKAEALHREALMVAEAEVGANELEEIELIYYLHSSSKVLLLAGKRAEAKQHLARCEQILRRYPQALSYLATVLEYQGYASFLHKVGKWSSQRFFKQALDVCKKLENEERVQVNTYNYARSLESCGQDFAANSLYKSLSGEPMTHYMENFTYMVKGLPPSDLIRKMREAMREIIEVRQRDG